MVTVSKNTVHSVFFLILDFISISCLFIMIGAEFLRNDHDNRLCGCSSCFIFIRCYDAECSSTKKSMVQCTRKVQSIFLLV